MPNGMCQTLLINQFNFFNLRFYGTLMIVTPSAYLDISNVPSRTISACGLATVSDHHTQRVQFALRPR